MKMNQLSTTKQRLKLALALEALLAGALFGRAAIAAANALREGRP